MTLLIAFSITIILAMILISTSHLILEYIGRILPQVMAFTFFTYGSLFVLQGFYKNNFFGLLEVLFGFSLLLFTILNWLFSPRI